MSPKKKKRSDSAPAQVALCYVRQSFTRDETDKDSPERQRANIERVCQENGWTPEWYEDAEGHKSARTVKNRPGWLALEKRLGNADVVALVGNDLARLHRKGWRVGDLIDRLEKHDISLVLAAPNRQVDTSTPMGRIFIQFAAIFDEYYSEDIAARARDSVRFRKGKGITIGMPPFGTERDADGHLVPSPEGAWLLRDGQFVEGDDPDDPPENALVWRSYYECAGHILTMYADLKIGADKIAEKLNEQGWPFRDRQNVPRPVKRDDVRRVLANWIEYGGVVMDQKAKDRPAYAEPDFDDLSIMEDRTVFPVKLLQKVAKLRKKRSFVPIDNGIKHKDYPYPLSGIMRCAHCAQMAQDQDDPRLITRLGGTNMNDVLRYRHQAGAACGTTNKSVRCDLVHEDFGRLIELLTIDEEGQANLLELSMELDMAKRGGENGEDPEVTRQKAIALAKRKLDAAIHLYSEGLIAQDEFVRRREFLEREISHWESWTTESEQMALELAMCIDAVEKLHFIWEQSNDEDRQGFVRNLFEWVEYDLDARRITNFRLKSWADRFIILRGALYEEDKRDGLGDDSDDDGSPSEGKKELAPPSQEVKQAVPHRGLEPLFPP
ncbi:MAG: recombinase family protein [Anaerolineae bacterium]|nr:recombinase family protein [Anaerolineae bacterium]